MYVSGFLGIKSGVDINKAKMDDMAIQMSDLRIVQELIKSGLSQWVLDATPDNHLPTMS